MANKEIFEGKGVINSKEECITKDGSKYWKFKIDNKTYSLFEHSLGMDVSTGDQAGFYWTETVKVNTTYRNLTSIFLLDKVQEETVNPVQQQQTLPPQRQTTTRSPGPQVKQQTTSAQPIQQQPATTLTDYKTTDADKFELGMSKNNAAVIIASVISDRNLDEHGESMNWEKIKPMYWKIVKELYEEGKQVRKEILGY